MQGDLQDGQSALLVLGYLFSWWRAPSSTSLVLHNSGIGQALVILFPATKECGCGDFGSGGFFGSGVAIDLLAQAQ